MKNFIAIICLCIGLFVSAEKARAYIIVPENCRDDTSKCLKSGEMEYVFVFGEIQYTDEEFFINLDKQWPSDKKIPIVWVETGGGYVNAAKRIGRILRKRHGIVATGNPITAVDKYRCDSACVLLAAGAEERHLREIGLHAPYTIEHKHKKDERIIPTTSDKISSLRSYLEEMGVNSLIADIIFNTPPERVDKLIFDADGDDNQQIVKLGFHMSPSDNFPDYHFSLERSRRYMYDDEELEFAALNGDIWAAVELANYYTRETDTRLPSPILERKWLQFAVDRGNAQAMHNMAVALAGSTWGKPDIKAANQLYKSASDLGFGPSQNNLGWHYYEGKGLKKNIPFAIQLITSSALQGEPFAYGSLCQMYGDGGVFPKDNVAAYTWCDLALDQMPQGSGLKSALDAMTKIAKNMKTDEIMEARQRASQWKPLKYPVSVMKGDEDD